MEVAAVSVAVLHLMKVTSSSVLQSDKTVGSLVIVKDNSTRPSDELNGCARAAHKWRGVAWSVSDSMWRRLFAQARCDPHATTSK
jgi:hypothetical protein